MAEQLKNRMRGMCVCGSTYAHHLKCKRCERLIHSEKRFCTVNDVGEYEGYVPTGWICWGCKQELKAEKLRDPKYAHKMEIQRRATKAYRLRNLERMKLQEKELAKKNRDKIWSAKKMKIASSAVEHNKTIMANRKFTQQHPGYHKQVSRLTRKQKRNDAGNQT